MYHSYVQGTYPTLHSCMYKQTIYVHECAGCTENLFFSQVQFGTEKHEFFSD